MIKKYVGLIIKYFNSYFQKSIKNKMIISITFFLMIPLTILTYLSYTRSSNSMEKEIINSIINLLYGPANILIKQ